MDSQRYQGTEVDLVFLEDLGHSPEQLAQIEAWAERVQRVPSPHKFIFVHLSPGGNRQLDDLMQYLQPEDEPGFRMAPTREGQSAVLPPEAFPCAGEKATRVRGSYYAPGHVKGKGQRKANRRDRWR